MEVMSVRRLWPEEISFRPLQFNYLSYELFLEKKSCQTPKKKKKSQHWYLTDQSGFEIFCQTPKKSASFKNIHCKVDSINYRKLLLL